MIKPQEITIKTYKYDGTPHRSWTAELIEQKAEMLVLTGIFDREIKHPDLGTILAGTISYEYYWLDRWYNVFRFHQPGGAFRNFYCNINMPPKFENGCLEYVDLDIDVLVHDSGRIEVLDRVEFAENSARYNYPPEVTVKALEALDEVKKLILDKAFPFSEK